LTPPRISASPLGVFETVGLRLHFGHHRLHQRLGHLQRRIEITAHFGAEIDRVLPDPPLHLVGEIGDLRRIGDAGAGKHIDDPDIIDLEAPVVEPVDPGKRDRRLRGESLRVEHGVEQRLDRRVRLARRLAAFGRAAGHRDKAGGGLVDRGDLAGRQAAGRSGAGSGGESREQQDKNKAAHYCLPGLRSIR
jgi:hypothetical protein